MTRKGPGKKHRYSSAPLVGANGTIALKILQIYTLSQSAIHLPSFAQNLSYPAILSVCFHEIQDSWAIAKTTARCAQYMGALNSFDSPHKGPGYFSRNLGNGLLFWSILRMCVQNLKFVALPVPEIIGGYSRNLGSPWIRPRSIFSQIFNRLLFGWTLWIYLPKWKFVAFSVPKIIGVL